MIGVDEAGYGPLLGPLVVAGAAVRVEAPAEDALRELPARLGRVLDRAAVGIRVGDSKVVHGRGGLVALERAVLPFALAAPAPHALAELALDALLRCAEVDPAERAGVSWYRDAPARFPAHCDRAAVHEASSALQQALGAEGLEFAGFAADVVPERRLNERFEATGNKATVLFETSADVASSLLGRRRPGEAAEVVFDRQGGRKRYLPPLQGRWPEHWAWTVEESRARSLYRLDGQDGGFGARFQVAADASVPPVALASMLAKYLREIFMALFNAWFAGLCPGVRPTAGYVHDGRRWLAETRGARERRGVPDDTLIRLR